ncbi:MAG TPA: plastocyanin/azurin family copper-binding protein [Gemmatimonadales bacterium]|nr:plastocyanin/azurin family copper-binding protein [Gemmatimonadales bacterium]
MFRIKTRLAFVSLAGALIACGGGYGSTAPPPPGPPPPPPPANTVAATNAQVFTPATLTVAAGQTVTFTFGSIAHNVFFAAQAGAPADIAGNNANVAIDRQFAISGTYNYTCHIHPSMHGSVVVQ